MATVPSGYAYYDASASTSISQGGTMPAPGAGDRYYGWNYTTGVVDNSKPDLRYYNSEVVTYYYRASDELYPEWREYTMPAGWRLLNGAYTMSSLSLPQTINGANVVSIYINGSGNKITSINVPSTIVRVEIVDAPNITTISGTFGANLKEFQCINATKLISVSSLANATSMIYGGYMFYQCTALKIAPQLPPNVTSLYRAFYQCTSLTTPATIPSKVIDMASMYEGCSALAEIPINNSTVALYMQRLFYDCENITDASNFNIPTTMQSGWEMFCNCIKLVSPPPILRGNNAFVYRMFQNCVKLTAAPTFEGSFSSLNTMFYQCSSLIHPPVIKHITNCEMSWMFAECTSLLDVPELPRSIKSAYCMFYNCTSLTWVNVIIPSQNSASINSIFQGCTNLTGVIWHDGTYSNSYVKSFTDTVKTIILAGTSIATIGPLWASTANNSNVYVGLNAEIVETGVARCNVSGQLDDKGEYAKLTIKFVCPELAYSKIYVPKVYIKNAQQQPIQDWQLTYTYNGDTIVKTIVDSTDITVTRIEANDLVTNGTFETIFEAVDDSVYAIYIPTSCSQVPQGYNDDGSYIIDTYYWNGTGGQAIFTGQTYIFDALPDGSSFKIGGPIIEENGDTGFIVGDEISLVTAQYPSTFNGPVTFNSNIYIAIDENASSEFLDGRIYDGISTLNWNDVLE